MISLKHQCYTYFTLNDEKENYGVTTMQVVDNEA